MYVPGSKDMHLGDRGNSANVCVVVYIYLSGHTFEKKKIYIYT